MVDEKRDDPTSKPPTSPEDTGAVGGEGKRPSPPAATSPPAPPAATSPPAPPAVPKVDPLREAVPSRAVDLLKERFPDEVLEVSYCAGAAIARIRKDRFVEIATFLRDDPELRMNFLSNLTAAHWPKKPSPYEVIYHLFSISKRHTLTLKIDLAEEERMPTATVVWETANWHEREVFDLFGIRFSGHPDLTRILMTDEWVGHPLRKDYPLEGKPEDHQKYREVLTAEHVYRYEKAPIRGFGWKKEVEKTGEGKG